MTAQELRHPPGKYRLTVEDYALLHGAGVFGEFRTELIEGEIVVMAPEYRPHAYLRDEIAYRLRRALEEMGSDLHAGSGSVSLSDHDMPQPDLVITDEPRGDGPIPLRSVKLLVEVSASTLDSDLGTKAELYATAGVPEYWVVDVNGATMHQMWAPTGQAYAERRHQPLSERIAAQTIAGLTIDLPAA